MCAPRAARRSRSGCATSRGPGRWWSCFRKRARHTGGRKAADKRQRQGPPHGEERRVLLMHRPPESVILRSEAEGLASRRMATGEIAAPRPILRDAACGPLLRMRWNTWGRLGETHKMFFGSRGHRRDWRNGTRAAATRPSPRHCAPRVPGTPPRLSAWKLVGEDVELVDLRRFGEQVARPDFLH